MHKVFRVNSLVVSSLDFLNEFRRILRDAGIRCAIAGGMACVRYGLQQNTKDSDWLVDPSHLDRLRLLFEAAELRMPPWRVRYRQIFGAPLEEKWLQGGWTSHLSIFTRADTPGHSTDWFGKPPRVSRWEPDAEGFASRQVIALMKKTNRPRDWPMVDGLAWQMRKTDPLHALAHLQTPGALLELWTQTNETIREQAQRMRPLLNLLQDRIDLEAIKPALIREREAWIAINEGRYECAKQN